MMGDILTMFKTVITSLFKKSACDMYPFKKPTWYKLTKGHIVIDAPKCILCSICARKCPTYAINVDKASRKWEIDHGKCILCNNCIGACPTKCLTMDQQYKAPSITQKLDTVQIPEKS